MYSVCQVMVQNNALACIPVVDRMSDDGSRSLTSETAKVQLVLTCDPFMNRC